MSGLVLGVSLEMGFDDWEGLRWVKMAAGNRTESAGWTFADQVSSRGRKPELQHDVPAFGTVWGLAFSAGLCLPLGCHVSPSPL